MRIFLVGNGTSTTPETLNKLVAEDCMAVNRISLIYPKTRWRPNFYYKTDYTFGQDWFNEIMPHVLNQEQCLLWDAFRNGAEEGDMNRRFVYEGIGDNFPNVKFVSRCPHVFSRGAGEGHWHEPICLGLNSVLGMTMWATQLGFDEIYLIGFDGNYVAGGNDHFVNADDYYGGKMDDDYAWRNNRKTMMAHLEIQENCPIPVYNCSKDSVFNMHPYKDIDEVLNAK